MGSSRVGDASSCSGASTEIWCRLVPVPREIIVLTVRWYLRYGLFNRDMEELLAERGIIVDHVTVFR